MLLVQTDNASPMLTTSVSGIGFRGHPDAVAVDDLQRVHALGLQEDRERLVVRVRHDGRVHVHVRPTGRVVVHREQAAGTVDLVVEGLVEVQRQREDPHQFPTPRQHLAEVAAHGVLEPGQLGLARDVLSILVHGPGLINLLGSSRV